MTKASARSATDLSRPTNIPDTRQSDFLWISFQAFLFSSAYFTDVRLQTISARRWCHPLFLTCNLNFFFFCWDLASASISIFPSPSSPLWTRFIVRLGLVVSREIFPTTIPTSSERYTTSRK
jgi:hypothetical protein